jgi:(S)-ureidoglycine aminohydrolase
VSRFVAVDAMRVLVLRKRYERAAGIEMFSGLYGHESEVTKAVWANDPGALLQTLIPDAFAYDLAVNIFTFSPGHGLPIVETHVMEHGALILQGKGLYYLEDTWTEVEKDDFIYMAPYCPQSFYATGTAPAKYIYYKNVNREIPL